MGKFVLVVAALVVAAYANTALAGGGCFDAQSAQSTPPVVVQTSTPAVPSES